MVCFFYHESTLTVKQCNKVHIIRCENRCVMSSELWRELNLKTEEINFKFITKKIQGLGLMTLSSCMIGGFCDVTHI